MSQQIVKKQQMLQKICRSSFSRSMKLSNDKAGTSAVIRDDINRMNNKIKFKISGDIPAAPFVKFDIKKGYNILKIKNIIMFLAQQNTAPLLTELL